MFETYSIHMVMRESPGRPITDAAPAVFEHLLALFAPRRLVFTVEAGELAFLTRGDLGHWDGEERTSEALTRCPPGDASALIAELRGRLAAANPDRLWIGAEGALLHRAPHTATAEWYGRWRMHRALHALIEPAFAWTAEQREVEIRFPLAGYPLTASELRPDPDGERWISDGDRAAASDNRARIFTVLAGLPAAVGLAADEVAWRLAGDTDALRTRFPDDARAIEEALARLAS